MDWIKKALTHKPSGEHYEIIQPGWDQSTIASHIVAFLNSDGGTILARDAEGSHKRLESELKNKISPKALFSINSEHFDGEHIFTIDVPGGKDLPFVYDGSIYLRKDGQTVKADAYDIQSLLQHTAATPQRWERKVSLGLEYEDLDQQQVILLHGNMSDENREITPEDMFVQVGFLRSDGQYINAADTCLAKRPSIRYPQIRVRLYMFDSPTSDTFHDELTLEGPINKLIQESFNFIRRNTATQINFNDSAQRESQNAYPDTAIREALVNALAHRDYENHSGGVTIKIFPNELRIWNSGQLPGELKQEDLTKTHPSIPRNPDVAQYLYMSKYMERIGRGTIKMIQACKNAKLPSPEWNLDYGVEVIFRQAQNIESFSEELNERQNKLLASITQGEIITSALYRNSYALDISQKQASRDLNELYKLGLLNKTGTGRGTKYLRT